MDPNDETAILQIRQRLENIKSAPEYFNRIAKAEAEAKAREFYASDVQELIGIAERSDAQAQERMARSHGVLKSAIEALVKALLERGCDANLPEIVVAKALL